MPWAVGALLATLVLSGCQAEETPPAGASPSAGSGSTSAGPSPTSPSPPASPSSEVPAAAREKSEAGAEAFTRHFFEQFNEAWTQPREGLIASLSDPACEFCDKTESTAAFLVKEGQRYSTDPVTIVELATLTGAPRDQWYLACDLVQNRSDIVDTSGTVVATDPRKEVAFNIAVTWSSSGWRMRGVEKGS